MADLRNPVEHDIQQAFFHYVRTKAQIDPRYGCIFAIPNARQASFGARKYYIKEGLETGVPDVCIAVSNRGYPAAFIEFKRRGANPNSTQLEWINRLLRQGFLVKVIDDIDTAIKFIDWYLKKGPS